MIELSHSDIGWHVGVLLRGKYNGVIHVKRLFQNGFPYIFFQQHLFNIIIFPQQSSQIPLLF